MNSLSRFLAFMFLSLLNISYANCSEQIQLKIIDYGIYENKFNQDVVKSNNVVAGVVKPSYSMEIIKKTYTIDAEIGIAFGFRFIQNKNSNFSKTQVKFCGEHPPMKNPETCKVATKECFNYQLKPKKLQWHTYVIENNWELIPGNWKLFIEHDDKILAEKNFVINIHNKQLN